MICRARHPFSFLAVFFLLWIGATVGCGPRLDVETLNVSSEWKRVKYPEATIPLSSELRILAWEDYIPGEILEFFGHTYGVRLIFDYITSNEELYQKMNGNELPYDLVMPSTYMVERLINEGRLGKIDHRRIPRIVNIDDTFFKLDHDPGLRYSVPLFYSSTGIALNVKYSGGLPLTWPEFAEMSSDPLVAGRMAIFDEMRTSLGMSLIMLGFSPNSRDPAEIATARDLLLSVKESIGLQFFNFEMAGELAENEIIMAATWSGDAAYALAQNGFVRYIIPQGLSIMEVDSFAIPVDARHPETAEFFLDFLLTPQVLGEATDFSYFANTSSKSLAFVERGIRNGPSYMKPLHHNIAFLEDVGEATTYYEEAWAEVIDAPQPEIHKLPLPFHSPLHVPEP